MAIFDSNNSIITNMVESAVSRPEVIEIKNRTLDGKWHIQTIGTAATVLDVVAHVTSSQKILLDNCKKTSSLIKVIFDGRYYYGLIDGELNYSRIASQSGPMFNISFTLLVQTEGVA